MRIKSSKKFIRFSAAITLAVFFINSIAFGQTLSNFQTAPLQNSISLSVPSELGSVIENKTISLDQPFLIHIQDAHANYSAQKNMSKIIEHLASERKIKTVFVEGAIGELDARYLKFSENRKLNRKVADRLARMGEMTAADLYLFDHPSGVDFIGIENVDLYRANLELFKKVMNREEESRAWIQSEDARLERDLSRSVNKDLLTALRIYLRQDKNTGSLVKVLSTLETLSERHLNRDLRDAKEQKDFPNLVRLMRLKLEKEKLDSAKVSAETKEIEKLGVRIDFSKGNPRFEAERIYAALKTKGFSFSKYPNFTRYVKHLIYERELDSTGLFDELDRWLELLMNRLAQTPDEKKALAQVKQAKLTAKLLVLELNRKDWAEIKNQKPSARALDAFHFYEKAEQRETSFFETIQKTLKSKNQKQAIVISGGFHTEALKKHFSDSRINYSVIMPGVEGDSRSNYVKTLLGRKAEDIAESDLGSVPQAEPFALAWKMGINISDRKAMIAKAASLGDDERDEEQPTEEQLQPEEIVVDESGWVLPEGSEAIIHAGLHHYYVNGSSVVLINEDYTPVKMISFDGDVTVGDKQWAVNAENLEQLLKYAEWKKLKERLVSQGEVYERHGGGNGGMYLVNVKDPKTQTVRDVMRAIVPGEVQPVAVKFTNETETSQQRDIVLKMIEDNLERIRNFVAVTKKVDAKDEPAESVFNELNIDKKEIKPNGAYVQQPLVILLDLLRSAKTLDERKKLVDQMMDMAASFWAAGFMDRDLRFANCGFDSEGRLVIHDFDFTMTMEEFQASGVIFKAQTLSNYIINNAVTLQSIDPSLRDYFLKKLRSIPFIEQILYNSEKDFADWLPEPGTKTPRKPFGDYVMMPKGLSIDEQEARVAEARKQPLLTLIDWATDKTREQQMLIQERERAKENKNEKEVTGINQKIAEINKEITMASHYFFEQAMVEKSANLAQEFSSVKPKDRLAMKLVKAAAAVVGGNGAEQQRQLAKKLWEETYAKPYEGYEKNLKRKLQLEEELGDWLNAPALKKWGSREEQELKALVELIESKGLFTGSRIFVGKKAPRFQMVDKKNATLNDYHFNVMRTDGGDTVVATIEEDKDKPSITKVIKVRQLGNIAFKPAGSQETDDSVSLADYAMGLFNPTQAAEEETDAGAGDALSLNMSFKEWAATLNGVSTSELSNPNSMPLATLSQNPATFVDEELMSYIFEKLEAGGKITFANEVDGSVFQHTLAELTRNFPDAWKKNLPKLDIEALSSGTIQIVYKIAIDSDEKVFEGYELSLHDQKWKSEKIYIQVSGNPQMGKPTRRAVRPVKTEDGKKVWEPVNVAANSLGSNAQPVNGNSLGRAVKEDLVPKSGAIIPDGSTAILTAGNSLFYVGYDRVALIEHDSVQEKLIQRNAVPFLEGNFLQRENAGVEYQATWATDEAELDRIAKFLEWKSLGQDVLLKELKFLGEGSNGEAYSILVKNPGRLLGDVKSDQDQVGEICLKVSKKATTRDEVYDEISKPENENLRKFMAKTRRLETEEQFREVGLLKPANYDKSNKVYVQEPVVVLKDVIRDAKSLDTRKFLIDQFVDRVEAFWRAGFIDMDSRPDNWGFNDKGELVFHDFDYTVTQQQFNNRATYEKFRMPELEFKAQIFAHFIANNASWLYSIDPQLTDYFLERIASNSYIREILMECEVKDNTNDSKIRFKVLMGLVKSWNSAKALKQVRHVFNTSVEYFKPVVINRKDELAGRLRQVPERPLKDSEIASIEEQKRRLAEQWNKAYREPYADYGEKQKRYEKIKEQLGAIVNSEIMKKFKTEDLHTIGILLNKVKELKRRYNIKAAKFVFVGKRVSPFQLKVRDRAMGEFHFVVVKIKGEAGKSQIMIVDLNAIKGGESRTGIMVPKEPFTIYSPETVPDPAKGMDVKLKPVQEGVLYFAQTGQPTLLSDQKTSAADRLGLLSEKDGLPTNSDVEIDIDKSSDAKFHTAHFRQDLEGALDEWGADESPLKLEQQPKKAASSEVQTAGISQVKDQLADLKKDLVARNAARPDIRSRAAKAEAKKYRLVIWKDIAKLPLPEQKAWLRALDQHIAKLETLPKDWVEKQKNSLLTLYADDQGFWVQGATTIPGEGLTYDAFDYDGKQWNHTYVKIIVPPGNTEVIQRITLVPAGINQGKLILKRAVTTQKMTRPQVAKPNKPALTKPKPDDSFEKWKSFIGNHGTAAAKQFLNSNAKVVWFQTHVRSAYRNRFWIDAGLEIAKLDQVQQSVIKVAFGKLSQLSKLMGKRKDGLFTSINIQENPFQIKISDEPKVVDQHNDIYSIGYGFNLEKGNWEISYAVKSQSATDNLKWKPVEKSGNSWKFISVKGSSLGDREAEEEKFAQTVREQLFTAAGLAKELKSLTDDDVDVRRRALAQIEYYAGRNLQALSPDNLKLILGYLVFGRIAKPQPARKDLDRSIRRTARTAMEEFGRLNPAAFTPENKIYLESLPLNDAKKGDGRRDLLLTFGRIQAKAAQANSLGYSRIQDEEVIIRVAREAADHLLYQGDLTQEGWFERVLGVNQASVQTSAPIDMPLDYVLAKLGINPAQIAKRRAMVVTQDLVKNPEVRAAILEGLKPGDRVIAVKNPILESKKYYDEFLKAARERGIEVIPFTNVSGIHAEDLKRDLRNIQERFSAETETDPNSIPKLSFPQFKINEAALQRGNVSMKLTMEIIMALAAVDEELVYQNAKFRFSKEDGFWHIDNSFAELMQSLFQEYQADQLEKKAA